MSGVRVYLTDAPATFDQVWVNISGVEIGTQGDAAGAWIPVLDEPRTLDLLKLQNDVTTILGDAQLEPGSYNQMRLFVDSGEAIRGEERQALTIPSGAQTGIKINLDFDVEPGFDYEVVLDFDAHESIRQAGRKLIMTPVIRIKSLRAVARDALVGDAGANWGVHAGDAGVPSPSLDGGSAG